MDKGTAIAIALAILPHIVALIPPLAKAEGVIGAVLNFLAGNYGAATNGKPSKK